MSPRERDPIVHYIVMGKDPDALCPGVLEPANMGEWYCPECCYNWLEQPVERHKTPVPFYSTSMDAAWEIFKHFAELPDEPFEMRYKKQFFMHELGVIPCNDPSWYDVSLELIASWTPDKICVAGLIACGIEKECNKCLRKT